MAGRRALRIAATPAAGVWRAAVYTRPERIEVIADADTGILLRFEEFFDGRTVQLTELTDVTFEPADEFAIPDDAEDDGEPAESRRCSPARAGHGQDSGDCRQDGGERGRAGTRPAIGTRRDGQPTPALTMTPLTMTPLTMTPRRRCRPPGNGSTR